MQQKITGEVQKVFVYFNINKKLFSIRSVKSGKVIGYSSELVIKDAFFKVSQAGRQRVLKEKRKNVHAGILGYISTEDFAGTCKISYNPYKNSTFVEKSSNNAVHTSLYCKLTVVDGLPVVFI